MPDALPPDAERFLLALGQCPTHEWVRAAHAYARARRSLMVAEARASLRAALTAARSGDAAAAAAGIAGRLEEAVRAVRPLAGDRVALRVIRQSAAPLAAPFRAVFTGDRQAR